jgi:hypothetical protein
LADVGKMWEPYNDFQPHLSTIANPHPYAPGVVVVLPDGYPTVAELKGITLDETHAPPILRALPATPERFRFLPAAPMDGFRLPRDGVTMLVSSRDGFMFEGVHYDRSGVDISFREPLPGGVILEVFLW